VSCLIDLSQGRKPPDGMVPIGFGDMTLSRMLALCRGMASLYLRIFKDAKLSESQRAARMLKDWPRNVYRMIDVLAAGEETDVTHGGILLRRHAHWAYKQLFHYVRDAGDIAELSSVLARYVPGDPTEARVELSIPHRTRERAATKTNKPKKQRRVNRAPTLAIRLVAARLGINVAALIYLRKNGIFQVHQGAAKTTRFELADVEAFESKVSEIAVSGQEDSQSISLEELFLRKFIGDGKGVLLKAIFDGQLVPVSRNGPKLSDLMLPLQEAECLRKALRQSSMGGTLSCEEAGELLGYAANTVASLCRRGLLRGYKSVIGFRVDPSGLAEFKETYVSFAEIARQEATVSRSLINAAQEAQVEVLRDLAQPGLYLFLHKADVGRLLQQFRDPRKRSELTKSTPYDSAGIQDPEARLRELVAKREFLPRASPKRAKQRQGEQ